VAVDAFAHRGEQFPRLLETADDPDDLILLSNPSSSCEQDVGAGQRQRVAEARPDRARASALLSVGEPLTITMDGLGGR
jgi:hypothetical protein